MSDDAHEAVDKERVDRELIELLNEIRVALPGVQVLFAFLLVLPFQQGFREINDQDKIVYGLALLSCALAAALLIAPSMYHRLNYRGGGKRKEQMVFDSNKLVIAGTLLTGLGVACAVYLVVDVAFGGWAAGFATFGVLATYATIWLGLPLVRRRWA